MLKMDFNVRGSFIGPN